MKLNGPLDRFIGRYEEAQASFDAMADSISNLGDPQVAQEFLQARQELQMHGWAASFPATKRHGLLKKVLDELR